MVVKLDDLQQVQAGPCLRDIIALSTLPAMWLGAKPVRVAESLAAALFTTLSPEFSYVCFGGAAGKVPAAIAQTGRYTTDPVLAERLRGILDDWARHHDSDEILTVPHPTGSGNIRIATRPLGLNGNLGVIAAGFAEPEQPTGFQQILLGIGATQAATAIQNAQLLLSLHESELRFRTVVDQASTGVVQADSTGRMTLVNQRWSEMLGYSETDLLQMSLAELTASETPPRMMEALDRLAGGESNIVIEERYRRKDGSFLWASSSVNALRNSNGEFLGLVAVVLDISAQKAAQARAELLSQVTQDVAALSDPLEINRVATRAIGEFLGGHRCYFFDVLPGGSTISALPDWRRENAASAEGSHDLSSFGRPEWWQAARNGPVTVDDVWKHPATKDFGENYQATKTAAYTLAPFVDKGQWVACLGVSSDVPRQWLPEETRLLENAVARVWPLIERARAEEKLRESRAALDFTLKSAQVGDWDLDLVHDTSRRSLRHDQCFGYDEPIPEADWGFERFIQHVHPDDRGWVERDFRDAVRNLKDWRFECRVIWPDGSTHWISAKGSTYRTVEGAPRRMLGIVTDITERKRAEESLRENTERFRFMAESMPQKIFTANPDGEVDYVNQQWIDFTGSPPEELRRWNWLPIIHPDDIDENLRRWKHSIRTGDYFEIEHRFRRDDGCYRWHLSRAHAMRDSDGDVVMWIGSNTDIDDQKRAAETLEQTVRKRTAELREKVRELEAFSYSISHDMRSPLRAMQGFSKALLDQYEENLDEEGLDYLRRIYRGSIRLDLLIQDVLAYSRTAESDLKLAPIDLAALVRDTVENYSALQEPTQVVIREPIPIVVGHEAFASQILSNLMTNAVKFSRKGVAPRIIVRAEEAGEGMIRILVEDNGIGIAPSHLSRIFKIFGRVYSNKLYEGTGIGLAIVKKAVERMGGAIGVDSTVGEGSTFWFTLKRSI